MDFVIKSLLIIFSLTGCIQAVTLDVNEGNSTCIKADLLASFSITYNTSNGTVCKTLETFYLNLGGKKKNLHQSLSLFVDLYLRQQRSSLYLTRPQWILQAARAGGTAAPRGWWQFSDLATRSA